METKETKVDSALASISRGKAWAWEWKIQPRCCGRCRESWRPDAQFLWFSSVWSKNVSVDWIIIQRVNINIQRSTWNVDSSGERWVEETSNVLCHTSPCDLQQLTSIILCICLVARIIVAKPFPFGRYCPQNTPSESFPTTCWFRLLSVGWMPYQGPFVDDGNCCKCLEKRCSVDQAHRNCVAWRLATGTVCGVPIYWPLDKEK